MICSICPRECRSVRDNEHGEGFCQMPESLFVSRAALHRWEEPCISGTRGSGTVFFSGCSLKCQYCQNFKISQENYGKMITEARLKEIFYELIEKGAHNINLVNPTHYSHILSHVLNGSLPVPVVWNSSGYEKAETLRALEGKVDVYLPDMKYGNNILAKKYSNAPKYFETARNAIMEMVRQTGPFQLDEDGMIRRGVIIRHLILPGYIKNSKRVVDWVAETFPPHTVMFSLMSQYTPCGNAERFPEIDRKLTAGEIDEVEEYVMNSSIEDGYVQDRESADASFIPDFNFEGI